MAVRTTTELVTEIIEVEEGVSLLPFISAASSLVDRVAARAGETGLLADGEGSGDKTRASKLQEIETWLAAHFYTVFDPRSVSEGAGGVSVSYQSRVDLRLFTSHYGQMAATLDETGVLEAINAGKSWGGTSGGKTVGVIWLGKTPEEEREEA